MKCICLLLLLLVTLISAIRPKNRDQLALHDEVEFINQIGTTNRVIKDFYQRQLNYFQCCENGRKYALTNGDCQSVFGLNRPSTSETFADDGSCRSLWSLCCLEQRSVDRCNAGIHEAITGSNYSSLACSSDNYLQYQCCSACQLGIELSRANDRQLCYINWDNDLITQRIGRINHRTRKAKVFSHIETSFRKCCSEPQHQLELDTDYHRSDKSNDRSRLRAPGDCPTGFKYDSYDEKCIDIDECRQDSSTCESEEEYGQRMVCINTIGSYRCSKCQPGYRWDDISQICVDLNECEDLQHYPCFNDQSCMNTVGSFVCLCQIGYVMDSTTKQCKDVNECQLGSHNCHESLRCDNTIGSFHCVRVQDCGTGYTINADKDVCEDVDECELGLHNCALPDYQCRNTEGSFKCDRVNCPPDHELENGICRLKKCQVGFILNRTLDSCVKVNPCDQSPCELHARCVVHAPGEYTCVPRCDPGYEYNFQVKECVDIDECAVGTAECGLYQRCINLQGHYDCVCERGFVMNQTRQCRDIDECSEKSSVCPYPYRCVNTIGSYQCNHCLPGYTMSPMGHCVDVNECHEAHHCQHHCVNTNGSYRCACRLGFTLNSDGYTCDDIDECALGNYTCVGVCENTSGSYQCGCPSGFQEANNHCFDINECLQFRNDLCLDGEQCINFYGGFQCMPVICPANYVKSTSFQSIQCHVRSEDYDTIPGGQFHRYSYLYFSLHNNQLANVTRSRSYSIYVIRYDTARDMELELKLLFTTDFAVTIDAFEIFKHRNEAKVRIVRELHGPLEFELELQASGIRNGDLYRQRLLFNVRISQYDSM